MKHTKQKFFSLFLFIFISLFSQNVFAESEKSFATNDTQKYFEKTLPVDFSKTLLIINYNHAYYSTIPFLKEIYSPVFPNIVFYGELPNPEVNVMPHHFGWYGQSVISDAMKKWPDYEGYLCLQDDCMMNFWNFARLDKTKIWFMIREAIPLHEVNHHWYWWKQDCGRNETLKAISKLTPSQTERLYFNIGKNNVAYSYHDFIYIPNKYRESFIEVCNHYENTFVELALPNILMSISDKNDWETLNFLWEQPDYVYREYNVKLDWAHPFKFSQASKCDSIREVVNQWKKINSIPK